MLFNSPEFLLFLPLVFAAYWAVNRLKEGLRVQNVLLLAASYVFYGWWDWRFLGLIAFSTAVDWAVGLQIARVNCGQVDESGRSRAAKAWLAVSLAVNLGLLGYFKYANFFIDSWVEVWAAAGVTMHASSLQVILPVGISFYTFQTLSYSIDIYRRQLEPTRNFIDFAAFVSFFPQLVAGPIERASALLPQIQRRRTFDYDQAVSGLRLILWGMFKKVVVADTCAVYVNDIFANYEIYSGPTLVLGAVYFAFQIYGDFSGYSDMAIGLGRMMGFRFPENFRSPYTSRTITEFWQRWHITLGDFMRNYLYIPLGGNRSRTAGRRYFNLAAVFLASGLWHGAAWNFVLWGAAHGALILLERIFLKAWLDRRPRLLGMLYMHAGLFLTWVLFRIENLKRTGVYFAKLFSGDFSSCNLHFTWSSKDFFLVAVAAFFAYFSAFPAGERLERRMFESDVLTRRQHQVLLPLASLLLFLGGLEVLGTDFNPFIYFRF